jgi:cytochrome bd-type quinol oxidase subunit 1
MSEAGFMGVVQLPPREFPLLGNSLAIGSVSLFHIAFASLAVGFMVLAPIAEVLGRSRQGYTEVARSLTRFTTITFTASLVLAVIMVELFIGLYPFTNAWLFNRFRYPIWIGIAAFLLQTLLLYPYFHFWDALRARSVTLHIAMGAGAALLMLVWVLMLDGIGSYMLTPVARDGNWSLFNPTWLPLVIHRFFGNFVIAGFAMSAYAAWRLRAARSSSDGEAYYLNLLKVGYAIGILALMIQPFTGFLYASRIQETAPQAFEQVVQGPYRGLVYVQFSLIALLLFGAHLLRRTADPGDRRSFAAEILYVLGLIAMVATAESPTLRRIITAAVIAQTFWYNYRSAAAFAGATGELLNRPLVRRIGVTLGVLALLIYLTMGTIRETARHPDTVRGLISLQDKAYEKVSPQP